MLNLPNNAVFNKIQTNNARIAPNATTNNTVVDHQNFSMVHPQRASADTLNSVLAQLDLTDLSQQTNGVLKGETQDGSGTFMITPGVIKFKKSSPPPVCPPSPPANYPPVSPPPGSTYTAPSTAPDTYVPVTGSTNYMA
jgi:hypothetical protein